MQIEVLSVSQPAFTKTAKGGYNKIEVAYKSDGKVQGKIIVDFDSKENPNGNKVYEFFTKVKQGDVVEVTMEKGEKYWNWTGAEIAPAQEITNEGGQETQESSRPTSSNYGDGPRSRPTAQARGKVTGSNYETPEERAIRRAFEVTKQGYIIRQSSISNAITTLARDGTKALDPKEVIEIASVYEAFVFGEQQESPENPKPEAIGDSDIPF